jgi:opacity protein-like surface antigen
LVDWPSDQFGFSGYIGPFGESVYLVPGLTVAHDPGKNITSLGAILNLHYMLPAGDRLVFFMEIGVAGTATRIDVLDFTAGDPPEKDRTTYIRGGFQFGAGIDIALGGNWSVTAAARGTFLRDIDTKYIPGGDTCVTITESPSYYELPRIAVVYWY